MKDEKIKRYGLVAMGAIGLAVMTHWSLKTVSILYGWPSIEFKHTVAVLFLLIAVRTIVMTSGRSHGKLDY